jgi:integrase
MASLQQRSGWLHLLFRYQGRQYSHALKTKNRREAEGLRGSVDRLLVRIRNGEFPPPPANVEVAEYLLGGGQAIESVEPAAKELTLKDLADQYLRAHSNGALESNSLATVRLHFDHLLETLGEGCLVGELRAKALQGYLDTRSRKRGKRERPLSPETLKKEMASLRAAWNWAVRSELLVGIFPGRALVYPKSDEKPPFQTREEIERKIGRGGLNAHQIADLWACWFLTKPELAEFLSLAADYTGEGFLHPMLAFAAHTGARRSELLRMQVNDLDLEAHRALIRERKRVRGQRSSRRVPISGQLAAILKGWLSRHPGGQHLFRLQRSESLVPLRRNEADRHFRNLVRGTRWERMRGWHVLRHSFISICASEGVDQRVLQGWVGHLSAVTHKRYTHLIPSREREIIHSVFG